MSNSNIQVYRVSKNGSDGVFFTDLSTAENYYQNSISAEIKSFNLNRIEARKEEVVISENCKRAFIIPTDSSYIHSELALDACEMGGEYDK